MQRPTTPAAPHFALRFWLHGGGGTVAAQHRRQHLALVAGECVAGLLHQPHIGLSGGTRRTGRTRRPAGLADRPIQVRRARRPDRVRPSRLAVRPGRLGRRVPDGPAAPCLPSRQPARRSVAAHIISTLAHFTAWPPTDVICATPGGPRRHSLRATSARGASTAPRFQGSIARSAMRRPARCRTLQTGETRRA